MQAEAVLAAELPSAMLVFGGLGWLLDRYVFGSAPWALVVGVVVGSILGMYLLYLRMHEDGRREDERRRAGA